MKKTIKQTINALCGTVLMVLVLSVVKLVVPISVASRFLNILIIVVYAAIGMITYFIYMKKTHSIDDVFGKDFLNKFKKKKKRA